MNHFKPKEDSRILFVDPGFGGTGFAITNGPPPNGIRGAGVFRFKPETTRVTLFEEQLKQMIIKWMHILSITQPDTVIIESTSVWGGDSKSQVSARSGSLIKLTALVGAYFSTAIALNNLTVKLVKAQDWKGNMPDSAVNERIALALNGRRFRRHEHDAIGMYLSAWNML